MGAGIGGVGKGAVVRHLPTHFSAKAERTPPCSSATRALPPALSAHCPAPRSVRGAGGGLWHDVGRARSVRKCDREMSSDTGRTEDATETHFGFQTVRSDQKAKLVGFGV